MKKDISRIVIIYSAAIVLGYLIGALAQILLLASAGYIVYLHKRIQTVLATSNSGQSPVFFYKGKRPDSLHELEATIAKLRLRDQSRKKKIRSLLKEFREATKALPDSIIALDYQNCITWTNKSAIRQLGIKTPDDIGMQITNVLRDPKAKEMLGSKNFNGGVIKMNSPVDSERLLEISRLEYGKNNKLVVSRDITDSEKSANLRAEFVANVSHELRTPITVFKGYIEELNQRQKDAPKSWLEPMAQMQEQAEKMSQLIEELLLLSKLQSVESIQNHDEVDVGSLINQAVIKAKKLSQPKEHFYSLQIDTSLTTTGSEQEIDIIVSNIIFNAARYTNNAGFIKIKWTTSDAGNHFQVSDNGIGITQENIPRITERFFRVNNAQNGRSESGKFSNTGLGLALVKHCAIRNNALLKIDSRINEGSTFSVTFPFRNQQ